MIFNQLIEKFDIHPVLVDIGSSGENPTIWNPIANQSIYVGFDPDTREITEVKDGKFYKEFIINKAITDDINCSEVTFKLTKYPHCSSVLVPDSISLSNFLYSDFFTVEREAKVDSITLDSALQLLCLKEINWLKTDTQGTDLRIFNSLPDEVRSQILAVDIEPGLIDAYVGEDLFIKVHEDLVKQGFWLSNANIKGSIRLKKSSLDNLKDIAPEIKSDDLSRYHKKAPGWCEARYLRTVDWLVKNNFSKSEYIMLWIFSMLDNQYGFALDVAFEYEKIFGKDTFSQSMIDEVISNLRVLGNGKKIFRNIAKFLPQEMKDLVRGVMK
jgi:hypothetical protein